MSLLESFELAVKNILASKTRALLTMLGIIIGVAAVIIIIGLGNGLKGYVENSFSSLGTKSLTVSIIGRGSSRTVTDREMYRFVEENPDLLQRMSPTVNVPGGIKLDTETYDTTSVTGVSEDYLDMKQYVLAEGRPILYADVANRERICVVGSYVAQTLFGEGAIGQTLRIGGYPYHIVGILVQDADGTAEEGGTDDAVYVPYTTASRLSANGRINSYTIDTVSESDAREARTTLETKLYGIFADEDAYRVTSMTELMDMMSSMINIIITVLAIIAGISLVVGGIGIMNIMLVSVTERTREIGIRKAMGATEGTILTQFVIEAAVTSSLGGIIGIAAGYGLCSLASVIVTAMLSTALQVTPSIGSILLAFGVSAAIGILFGYLPARRAAALHPIDALRHE